MAEWDGHVQAATL